MDSFCFTFPLKAMKGLNRQYCSRQNSAQANTSRSRIFREFLRENELLSKMPKNLVTLPLYRGSPTRFSTCSYFFIIQPSLHGLKYFRIWIFLNLPVVSYCAEANSPQYDIALSQSPRSIILRGVMWLLRILFKGTFQQDNIQFFIIRPAWATDQWVKLF